MSKKMFIVFATLLTVVLLLNSCAGASVQPTATLPPAQPATATPQPADTPVPLPTQAPAQPTQSPSGASGSISLDLSGVAQDQTVETVAAVPHSTEGPWWEAMPQYTQVTLQGYPITNHLLKPQIFIYPVKDLGVNPVAGAIMAKLQTQLQNQQAGQDIPYLPLYNAAQVMHAQVKYLDFKSGKGVRFLTQFDQALLPINNYELIYTFQGLTSDGKYYIAVVLPVTNPELPATQQVSPQQETELSDFPAYMAKTVAWLEQQPGSSFTPDLSKLDGMIQSIEIK